MTGFKHDEGKMMAAIPYQEFPHALREVARVATFGARKYVRGNWVYVENAQERYSDALHRHLLAHYGGEKCDAESGISHFAHAAWNLLALLEMQETRAECGDAANAASTVRPALHVKLVGTDLSNNGFYDVLDVVSGIRYANITSKRIPSRAHVIAAVRENGNDFGHDTNISYGDVRYEHD